MPPSGAVQHATVELNPIFQYKSENELTALMLDHAAKKSATNWTDWGKGKMRITEQTNVP
jgi:hypothetical protein